MQGRYAGPVTVVLPDGREGSAHATLAIFTHEVPDGRGGTLRGLNSWGGRLVQVRGIDVFDLLMAGHVVLRTSDGREGAAIVQRGIVRGSGPPPFE